MQVVSSMTITPAEPAIEPAAARASGAQQDVEHLGPEDRRGRAAGDHGLERPAAGRRRRASSSIRWPIVWFMGTS